MSAKPRTAPCLQVDKFTDNYCRLRNQFHKKYKSIIRIGSVEQYNQITCTKKKKQKQQSKMKEINPHLIRKFMHQNQQQDFTDQLQLYIKQRLSNSKPIQKHLIRKDIIKFCKLNQTQNLILNYRIQKLNNCLPKQKKSIFYRPRTAPKETSVFKRQRCLEEQAYKQVFSRVGTGLKFILNSEYQAFQNYKLRLMQSQKIIAQQQQQSNKQRINSISLLNQKEIEQLNRSGGIYKNYN